MTKLLAMAAIAGGLIAAAAPAHATGATDSPASFNKAAAIATVVGSAQAEGVPADVEPQLVRVYRGSFLYLGTCDTYGRSWVSSGSARAYNCGLDSRYPGLPWSLYTFH